MGHLHPLELHNRPTAHDLFVVHALNRLGYLHHRPRPCGGKFPPSLLKVIDDLLNDCPKFLVNFDRIVAMNSGD